VYLRHIQQLIDRWLSPGRFPGFAIRCAKVMLILQPAGAAIPKFHAYNPWAIG